PGRAGNHPRRLRRSQRPGGVPDPAGDRDVLRRTGSGGTRPGGGRCLAQLGFIPARTAAIPRRRGTAYPGQGAIVNPAPVATPCPFRRAGIVVTPYPWSLCNVLELAALPSAGAGARLPGTPLS